MGRDIETIYIVVISQMKWGLRLQNFWKDIDQSRSFDYLKSKVFVQLSVINLHKLSVQDSQRVSPTKRRLRLLILQPISGICTGRYLDPVSNAFQCLTQLRWTNVYEGLTFCGWHKIFERRRCLVLYVRELESSCKVLRERCADNHSVI